MNTPIWQPKHSEKTQLWQFMRFAEQAHTILLADYQALHQWSIANPKQFWSTLCDFFKIKFTTPPTEILNVYKHPLDARWFTGATLNFAQQLLRRKDNHPALISINESGQREVLSYHDLNQQVAACAQGLKQTGIKAGDRVGAIMPNVSQTMIAMLATASLGAVWASCSSDFGAQAAIDRLGQIEPTVLFMADGHQYNGKCYDARDKIVAVAKAIPSLKKIVICSIIDSKPDLSALPQTVYWNAFIQPTTDPCQFIPMPFAAPLYILFSSGTTGRPKCIIHSAGGTLLQHLKELGLHTNLDHNDNLCFYTTCGWMMWNWMVSTLALGATLTLYEGSHSYPDLYRLFQLLDEEKVTVFGTSAKFLSSVEKSGINPKSRYPLTQLRTILSTGSPLLPAQYDFVLQHIKPNVQIASISGGTDIVSCFALGNPILPVYRGELQCLGLGMAVNVFNEHGQPVIGQRGELVCTNAFPCMPVGFWNDPEKKAYHHAYFERFPGVWTQGDFAELTPHHGLIIYGRSDTVLNPGGVRIGTAEIYRQVETIPEVLESVVIGQDWQDDVRVILFVKLRQGLTLDETLKKTISQTIRQNASPRHVPAIILQVPDIPRTINGKVVELAVKQVVQGQSVSNLHSLANPDALTHFKNRSELYC